VVLDDVPDEISHIQMTHADYGEFYSHNGLLHAIQIQSPEYFDFLHALAKRICAAAVDNPLPILEDPPIWEKIEPLFPLYSNDFTKSSVQGRQIEEPRYATFVWVVATRDEITAHRSLAPYDKADRPEEWRPFSTRMPSFSADNCAKRRNGGKQY
jgi:hypothetical protein